MLPVGVAIFFLGFYSSSHLHVRLSRIPQYSYSAHVTSGYSFHDTIKLNENKMIVVGRTMLDDSCEWDIGRIFDRRLYKGLDTVEGKLRPKTWQEISFVDGVKMLGTEDDADPFEQFARPDYWYRHSSSSLPSLAKKKSRIAEKIVLLKYPGDTNSIDWKKRIFASW